MYIIIYYEFNDTGYVLTDMDTYRLKISLNKDIKEFF